MIDNATGILVANFSSNKTPMTTSKGKLRQTKSYQNPYLNIIY